MSTKKRNGNNGHSRIVHEKRIAQFNRAAPEPRGRYNNSGEGEVVPTYQLAAVLREWSRRWLAEYDPSISKSYGPINYLSEHTGIDPRQISRITNEETPITSLTHADKLLMAMGKEHMLSTGEIQVVPNPNWSLEKYVELMKERGVYGDE